MSNAPDRIHITTDLGMVGTGRWTSAGLENPFKQPVFIPSTPARENADELVKALEFYANGENWRMNGPLDVNSPRFDGESRARTLLAKIKEASNE